MTPKQERYLIRLSIDAASAHLERALVGWNVTRMPEYLCVRIHVKQIGERVADRIAPRLPALPDGAVITDDQRGRAEVPPADSPLRLVVMRAIERAAGYGEVAAAVNQAWRLAYHEDPDERPEARARGPFSAADAIAASEG